MSRDTQNGSVWKRYECFPSKDFWGDEDINGYIFIMGIHVQNLRMFGGAVLEIWGVQGGGEGFFLIVYCTH